MRGPLASPVLGGKARAVGYSQLGNVYLVVVGVSGETREHSGQQMSAPALETNRPHTPYNLRGCHYRSVMGGWVGVGGTGTQTRVGVIVLLEINVTYSLFCMCLY